jgi:ATP-binding cassette subfamily C protein
MYTHGMREQIKSIHRVARLALDSSGKSDKYKLLASLLSQILLGLADLFGVLVLGVLSSRILNEYLGTSRSKVGALAEIEKTFHLENLKAIEMAALVVVIFLFKSIASLILSWKLYALLTRCANSASNSFLDDFLETPFVLVRKMDNQKLPFAFMEGINAFSIGVLGNLVLLCADFAMIIVLLIGLAQLDLIATVFVAALFGVLTYLLMLLLTPKIRRIGSLGTSLSIQGRNSILDIKELFQEFPDRNKSRYFELKARKIRMASSKNYSREQWFSGLPKNLMETAGILGIFLVLLFASILGPTESNVGLVTAFLAATSRIIPALLRIQANWLSINRNVGYVDEALPVLMKIAGNANTESRFRTMRAENPDFASRTGGLSLTEVTFRYPDSDRDTLQNISISVSPGEKIAIIGDSGSGKTTLSNLILGLLDPTSGFMDFAKESGSALKHSLSSTGYLPQRPYIFSGSILENICLTNDLSHVNDCWLRWNFTQRW